MYREDPHPKDLNVDPEELLAAQKRLRRKQLVGLAVGVAILGGAGGTGAFVLARRAEAARQGAWSRAATCIAGAGEGHASARVRNAQLVAMGMPAEKRRALGAEAWPDRCAPPLHALAEAAKESGDTSGLAEASEKLATAASSAQGLAVDLGPRVDDLFAKASAAGLALGPAAADVPEPARAAPMVLASLPKEARMFAEQVPLASIHRSPIADETPRFVVDDSAFARGPALCELAESPRAIHCTKIPPPAAAMSPALRLWGTTAPHAAPYVFAGDRGKSGIFRSDTGARVVEKLENGAYGATALDDGSLGYLNWQSSPPETHFVHVASDGTRQETLLVPYKESSNPYYTTSIFWSHAVYKSVRRPGDGIRLVVRDIDPAGHLGAPIDVGRIAEAGQIEGGESEEPHLTGCRAGDTTVIRAKGWNATYLSFLVGGKWTAPVEASGLGGTIVCRPGEAMITRVRGVPQGRRFKGGVDLEHCTVSGCEDRSFRLDSVLADNDDVLPRDARAVRTADIDGKILLLWFAGDRGGLRARFAAPGELASAADTILYDDHVRDGALQEESTMVDIDLIPAPHGALLLFGTIEGVYAFFFDAAGKPSPVTTTL